jgi:hypothetical protein
MLSRNSHVPSKEFNHRDSHDNRENDARNRVIQRSEDFEQPMGHRYAATALRLSKRQIIASMLQTLTGKRCFDLGVSTVVMTAV